MTTEPIEPGSVYDERETCRLTRLSARTLQRGRADATGPAYVRLGSTRIGYRGADILKWLEANTYRSAAAERAARQEEAAA